MPQIKKRITEVDLPPEYEGFKVKIWVNAPTKLWAALNGGNEAVMRESLGQIVVEHNNWLDFDCKPYPPASDPAFWDEIPTELAACILVAAQTEMQRLPNSIAPQRRR